MTLDFSSAVVCQLDEMKDKKVITGLDRFFESIFPFAKDAHPNDPAWGLSDKIGGKSIMSVLKRLVHSLLPNNLGEDFERISHLAIRDVAKPTS